ncbi:hypothetical protein VTN77DRAFT_6630 [Rasamsonia byssochlamydoides]|uniref:uncharacterized protein n=1 Tax=Rasamsonia byssochlamydoides TaxID=89139 RepID=UPI003743C33A
MHGGFEAISKIPYPLTVPKGLTTESEVATLDFLHSKGIPVPRVYTWSSKSDNPVGTEYIIIMEKASGKPLADCCLYYKDSLPQDLQADLYAPGTPDERDDAARFCIGPTADYMFWRGKRALLDLNRGPWKDQRDYVRSIGVRELEWTRQFGEISPVSYMDLLEKYLSISPYVLPEDRGSPVNKPHYVTRVSTIARIPVTSSYYLSTDLNPSNVFVTDSCGISCLIDWQHTSTLPLLLTAGNPPLFENPDPEPPKGSEKPSLPADYESLDPEEKSHADELYRRRMLFYLYMVFNGKDNRPYLDALRYPALMLRQNLVDRAGRQWSGNIITLKGALVRAVAHWDQLVAGQSEHI